MTIVSRVCPTCGESSPLENRYCAHCGEENSGGTAHKTANAKDTDSPQNGGDYLPNEQTRQSIQLGKAALPLIAGAAGFLVKVGWKLLQSKVAQDAALNAANTVIQSNLQKSYSGRSKPVAQSEATQRALLRQTSTNVRKPSRTIRISSKWAVGDANGILRQGQSEHTIEIDD